MNQEIGVIYAATGHKYRQECIRSLISLKQKSPDISVTVFTDNSASFDNYVSDLVCVNELKNPEFGFRDKITAMEMSPYRVTLFLDTDTIIASDIKEIFFLAERFEFAVAPEVYQPSDHKLVPASFPEFNSGVILYKNTPEVTGMLKTWGELYDSKKLTKYPPKGDQEVLREVLYLSEINFTPLSTNWNFCTTHSQILNAGASIVILHTRHSEEQLSSALREKSRHCRVFLPCVEAIHPLRLNAINRYCDLLLNICCLPFRAISVLKGILQLVN